MNRTKDSHCSYCGLAFPAPPSVVQTCGGCGQTTWRNPVPVAAVLVPVISAGSPAAPGLLTVCRSIEPGLGRLTFPGGYVNYGESWQQAACRELEEETGLRLAEPDELTIFEALSTSRGHMVCLFGLARPCRPEALHGFRPTAEASAIEVIHQPGPLAFPQDVAVAQKYFAC